MKINAFCIFLIGSIFCCHACSESSELAINDYTIEKVGVSLISGNLKVVDTLKIALDSITSNRDPYLQISEIRGEPYLVMFNLNNYHVQGYHLYNPTKNWKLRMFAEGPNSIMYPERFYLHNMDSIFFINGENVQKVFLANSSGSVMQTYDLGSVFATTGKNGKQSYW